VSGVEPTIANRDSRSEHGANLNDPLRRIVAVAVDGAGARALQRALSTTSCTFVESSTVADAEQHVRNHPGGILILDQHVATPETVIDVLRRVPAANIVVWGGSMRSEAIAACLEAGALDSLSQRMSDVEISARLRRLHGGHVTRVRRPVQIGLLRVDTDEGSAMWGSEPLQLTRREREVLDVLARNHATTVRREVLYRNIWGHAMPGGDRNVDVNITRLRAKLLPVAGDDCSIETMSGVGYRLMVHAVVDDEKGTHATSFSR
jgi:two-component system, OmpR family, response regulator TctD